MFSFQKNILVFVCFTFVCFDIHKFALRRQFHTIQKSYWKSYPSDIALWNHNKPYFSPYRNHNKTITKSYRNHKRKNIQIFFLILAQKITLNIMQLLCMWILRFRIIWSNKHSRHWFRFGSSTFSSGMPAKIWPEPAIPIIELLLETWFLKMGTCWPHGKISKECGAVCAASIQTTWSTSV